MIKSKTENKKDDKEPIKRSCGYTLKKTAVQLKHPLLQCRRSNDADNIMYSLKSMTNIELENFSEYVFIYLIYS